MNQSVKKDNFSGRNYGIDLLRLCAAFYVIILHTVHQGGIYAATEPWSHQNYVCRILLIVSYCAVNIFGIVSGYVGYRESAKKISYGGYLPLWLTVVFYSASITGIFMCILPGTVTFEQLVSSFFPLSKAHYWYFSSYTLVYFLAPFLNRFLSASSDRELKLLFFIICCVIVPIEYIGKSFCMFEGYSAAWLLLLYLIGAIMKKTGIGSKIPSYALILAIALIDFCFFFLGVRIPNVSIFIFNFSFDIHYSYITPFYLAAAILHVILFSKLKIHAVGQRLIAFAAPAAFAVYISNTQPVFWTCFMDDRFAAWAAASPFGLLIRVIAFSAIFVFAVVIVDFFKRKLFLFLGVQNWSKKLSGAFLRNPNL